MSDLPSDRELRELLAGRITRQREKEISEQIPQNQELQFRLRQLSGEGEFAEEFSWSGQDGESSEEEESEGAVPSRIGKFEILGLIQSGGMGKVFRARDPELDRIVAVKVISSSASEHWMAELFRKEASSIAAIEHPNVLPIYEIGDHEGSPFMVTQFIEGESLAERMERYPNGLPVDEAVEIALAAARGLEAVHAVGIVHRDFKPGNILLEKNGRILLADFGIAVPEGDESASKMQAGTPEFMSPEQILSEEVDQRSDLFSFGSVLYLLIEGECPFPGDNRESILWRVANEEARPFSYADKAARGSLEKLALRLLEKEKENRPANASELVFLLGKEKRRLWMKRPLFRALTAILVGLLVVALSLKTGLWVSDLYRYERPFVLDSGERFGSLSEAVETGDGRGWITVERDGVLSVEPMVWEGDLLIRAAEGRLPFLVAKGTGRDEPFWSGSGNLALTGIGLQYAVGKDSPPPFYFGLGGRLELRNCRLTMTETGGEVSLSDPQRSLLAMQNPQEVLLHRNVIIGWEITLLTVTGSLKEEVEIKIHENLSYCRSVLDLRLSADSERVPSLDVRNNAIRTSNFFRILQPEEIGGRPPGAAFVVEHNLINAAGGTLFLESYPTADAARNFVWKGKENLYVRTPLVRLGDGTVLASGFPSSSKTLSHFHRRDEQASALTPRPLLRFVENPSHEADFSSLLENPWMLEHPSARANLDKDLIGPSGLLLEQAGGKKADRKK